MRGHVQVHRWLGPGTLESDRDALNNPGLVLRKSLPPSEETPEALTPEQRERPTLCM